MHANCVSIDGKGLLIVGASGSGKSALSLQLMALGAALVADDKVELSHQPIGVFASAPSTIHGLIEARGIGILNADASPPVRLSAVVTLDEIEAQRLPPDRFVNYFEQKLPLLHKVEGIHFAAALMQFLRAGRSNR